MRVIGLLTCLFLAAMPAAAQTPEEDKSLLEGWIEEALSGAGRTVSVTGFEGALSSSATLEELTIADADGTWLRLRDAVLVWSRSALFQGRLDVTELTAGSIEVTRLPEGDRRLSPNDAEATPFALPELPVSVSIETLRAETVSLGAGILGEPATFSVESSLALDAGTGQATLDIRRAGRDDRLSLEAAFDNASQKLRIALDFDEEAGGIAARTLRIPGAPALRLRVQGDAPLSDFTARVSLSSAGARHLDGSVRISALGSGQEAGYGFTADLSGDLRPLVAADLHPFFGPVSALWLNGATGSGGGVTLDELRLTSGGMQVTGNLSLTADGWPEHIRLDGRLGGDAPLRLPVRGPVTTIGAVDFLVRYDAATGDTWQVDLEMSALERGALRVGSARLEGSGTMTTGPDQTLAGNLGFTTKKVSHDDPAFDTAIGVAPEGRLQFAWRPESPVQVDLLSMTSGDTALVASGAIDGLTDGFPVTGRAAIRAGDLRRFAGLAGRDLAGAGNATLQGSGTLLGGVFDVEMAASARNLGTGTARLDPLLSGRSTFELAARRDENGTFLDRLRFRNPSLSADATARLSADGGTLDLEAALSDISLAEPRLSGAARIETGVDWQGDGTLTVRQLSLDAADAVLTAEGVLDTSAPGLPAKGRLTLRAADLSRFAALAGRALAGSANLSFEGAGAIGAPQIDAAVELAARDFRSGIPSLDRVLGGTVDLVGDLAYGEGAPVIDSLRLNSRGLQVTAESPGPGAPVTIEADLADMGLLAAGVSGRARLRGSLTPRGETGRDMEVDLDFSGPAGTAARLLGDVTDLGRKMALSISGTAPLALANDLISPHSVQGSARFDLRLEGPPALSSLSGEIGTSGARVALPALKTAIENLAGTVRLDGGQARPDLTGDTGRGGGFRLSGPIDLKPPFSAALEATLDGLVLADPGLFETALSGRATVTGPLTGGAVIGGAIRLGRTGLRLASAGDAPGTIPDIRHVGAPAAVTSTRRRAGLIETGARSAAAFPLDLVIDAPDRIFVRGRGLDAELGGRIRLGGTTAEVAASGFFKLIRGRIDILARRVELTEGRIDLRGALDPWLRFVARTQTDELTIDIILEGLASDPEITIASVPELPQEEVLAQLLFGRSFTRMSAFQAAQLVGAAVTLSGHGSGGLTGRLRNAFGISDLDITSTEDGTTQFRAGAYLSENVYSEITADSEGRNEINLNLDLSPSLTVRGKASNEGETGIGIFFERDY